MQFLRYSADIGTITIILLDVLALEARSGTSLRFDSDTLTADTISSAPAGSRPLCITLHFCLTAGCFPTGNTHGLLPVLCCVTVVTF